jgi:hypothetical protein
MFKLRHLRLLFVAAWCLLLPASVHADAIKTSFGENASAFSFTIVNGAVNRDVLVIESQGAFWDITVSFGEDNDNAGDTVVVNASVSHIKAPHDEPQGMLFRFEPGAFSLSGTAKVTLTTDPLITPLNHLNHVDNYQATLTFSVVNGQITGYTFHLDGKHCIGNDCPALPPEVDLPEPASMFLLGTGLLGVAIKTRKRLKNRKSG